MQKSSSGRKPRSRFTGVDIAALVLFLILSGILIYAAFYGGVSNDEAFYTTISKRVLDGDRLLIHEWEPSQLSSVFLLLPHFLFVSVTGSTDGLILFMRLLFVGTALIAFWYFYLKLRGRGKRVWGLLAAILFCSDFFGGIMTLNYYTMAIYATAVFCMIVFLPRDPPPRRKLFFAGVLFACAVLNTPGFALTYFAYSALVLIRSIRQKRGISTFEKYGFVINGRSWRWISAGIVFTAAMFMIGLFAFVRPGDLMRELPELLTNSEYPMTLIGNAENLKKAAEVFSVFHIGLIVLLAVPAAVLILRLTCRQPGETLRRVMFFSVLSAALFCAVAALINGFESTFPYIDLPVLLASLDLCLLCGHKSRKMFCFWIMAAACAVEADYFSAVTLGDNGKLAFFPLFFFACMNIVEMFPARRRKKLPEVGPSEELRTEDLQTEDIQPDDARTDDIQPDDRQICDPCTDEAVETRKKRNAKNIRMRFIAVAALIAFTAAKFAYFPVVSLGNYVGFMYRYQAQKESVAIVTITDGPLRGIRTVNGLRNAYDGFLEEMDLIQIGKPNALYIAGMYPVFYLYVDCSVGVYSTYYIESDARTRTVRYWTLHPEKRPDTIYVPLFDINIDSETCRAEAQEKLAFFDSVCRYKLVEGKLGYILYVTHWDI
ncbi:MAG: hypothetical protein IJK23_11510 [Clostridia bacterium]|nr:hypothetical protein [Clostridia bacterium]